MLYYVIGRILLNRKAVTLAQNGGVNNFSTPTVGMYRYFFPYLVLHWPQFPIIPVSKRPPDEYVTLKTLLQC